MTASPRASQNLQLEDFKLLVYEATQISQQAKGIVSDGLDSSLFLVSVRNVTG
jgi:hypothetical protein